MVKKSILEDLHDQFDMPFRREEVARHYAVAIAAARKPLSALCSKRRTSSFQFTDLFNQK